MQTGGLKMSDTDQIIDVTPEAQEARSVALALPDNARTIRVVDYVSKVAANAFFLKCREARKLIAAHYDPKIDEWKAAKKLADDSRAKMVAEKTSAEAPIVEAEGIVKSEILRFDEMEQKRLAEERREADMRSRKEAEDALLRAAADAEAVGDVTEADALLEEAAAPRLPIFSPPPPPVAKLSGTAVYEIWKFEVTDLRALVNAVASGRIPITAVCADEKQIGQAVRAMSRDGKSSFNWPGIRVWPEKGMKPTGR
jgi:hypothetical protein